MRPASLRAEDDGAATARGAEPAAHPAYRPEIDGLRAVALVPVVLFHADVALFRGGFVGVDVFFVISGYLITSIIAREMAEGRFSIADFYERRARRILPALFVVMAATIPFAWAWLLPPQQHGFARSLVAVPLFVSNVLFWRETRYFHPDAEEKPLLHTWSLAVEEQYYILFPLLMLLLWRFGRARLALVLAGLAVASLVLAEWGVRRMPSAAFYLAPFRAWELLAGALCALCPVPPARRWHGVAALTGLAMILAAVLLYDRGTPFPSAHALLPVGGTVLVVLFARAEGPARRALTMGPVIGLGLISYSVYLWHQPLLALARSRAVTELPGWALPAIALLAVPLGYLSWRFVERPFRARSGVLPRRRSVFAASLAAICAVVLIGMAGAAATRGAPDRLAVNYGDLPDCAAWGPEGLKCLDGGGPVVVVYGDSYAANLVRLVRRVRPDATLYQATKPACAPLDGLSHVTPPTYGRAWAETCLAFNRDALAFLGGLSDGATVILSSPFANTVSGKVLRADGAVVETGQMAASIAGLVRTVERIRALGHRVVVVAPLPNSGHDIGACLARSEKFGMDAERCDFTRDDLSQRTRDAEAVIAGLPAALRVLRLGDQSCEGGRCSARLDGAWLYRDPGHIAREGADALARRIGWDGIVAAANAAE